MQPPHPDHVEAFPVCKLPGSLPTAPIPEDTDPAQVLKSAIKRLSLGFRAGLFVDDAQWRDLLALTGNLRTFIYPKRIEAAWRERSKIHEPTDFADIPGTAQIARRGPKIAWVQGKFSFETHGTPPATCSGLIGLVPEANSSSWKIWYVITIMERIQGIGNVDVLEPCLTPEMNYTNSLVHNENNKVNGAHPINGNGNVETNGYVRTNGYAETNGCEMTNGHAKTNGHAETNGQAVTNGYADTNDGKKVEANGLTPKRADFNCVVCGGGQSGLAILGRLKAGGVANCIAIDRTDVIGGIWQNRYDSVHLHTSKDISQMPFGRIFPPEDPYYLGKEHLVHGYNKFVKQFGLTVWTSTDLKHAFYEAAQRAWFLKIVRNGEPMTITTKHLVLAIGPGGTQPKMPTLPNREAFKGVVMHSIQYRNSMGWAGKKGVLIGSGNTAHDIAEDMVNEGLESVTMVQRGRTCIVPAKYMRRNIEPLYGPGSDIEGIDRVYQAMPTALARLMINYNLNTFASQEPEQFDALEKAGFKVDREIDMIHILYERVGGHYMDVGTSEKIVAGQIKMKSDARLAGFTSTGLVFDDGSTLDTDIVIFATGFESNPRNQVVEIVGEEVEDQLDDMWGCDREGEIRGLWKPMQYPGIWYAGGGISQTRFYSRFLALQVAANLAGTPLPVYYGNPEV